MKKYYYLLLFLLSLATVSASVGTDFEIVNKAPEVVEIKTYSSYQSATNNTEKSTFYVCSGENYTVHFRAVGQDNNSNLEISNGGNVTFKIVSLTNNEETTITSFGNSFREMAFESNINISQMSCIYNFTLTNATQYTVIVNITDKYNTGSQSKHNFTISTIACGESNNPSNEDSSAGSGGGGGGGSSAGGGIGIRRVAKDNDTTKSTEETQQIEGEIQNEEGGTMTKDQSDTSDQASTSYGNGSISFSEGNTKKGNLITGSFVQALYLGGVSSFFHRYCLIIIIILLILWIVTLILYLLERRKRNGGQFRDIQLKKERLLAKKEELDKEISSLDKEQSKEVEKIKKTLPDTKKKSKKRKRRKRKPRKSKRKRRKSKK